MTKKRANVNSADGAPASTAKRIGEPAGEFMEAGQEVVPRDAAARHLSRVSRHHPAHRPHQQTQAPADDSARPGREFMQAGRWVLRCGQTFREFVMTPIEVKSRADENGVVHLRE